MCLVKWFHIIPGQSFKAILFDVDSKDSTVGMSCPPVQFLEQDVLSTVQSCIRENGNGIAAALAFFLNI